ncbi:TadE family protein [Novosphingobium sediminicola]|uniref:Flp pilus assembly protein TadG n=1 Tax=Novosphingobium sediminicola TaxID=563162 RepID=A0A7W6G8Y4_9SPHN|nr:TadE family protein [Novosphingobium sediminicola]MBB3957806.1 Flp pilus assembly protein TadG [Novosphingobium sediminicola]
MMPILRLRHLLRDLRAHLVGTATIEFALWSILVFVLLLPCLDLAAYLVAGSSMGAAVDQAAILAYDMRNSDTIDTTRLSGYVASTAWVPNGTPSTKITCNGEQQSCAASLANRPCACVSGLSPIYTPAAVCGMACPSGATSGFYLTVQAQVTYQPMIVPDRWLAGSTLARSVTVRLQ